MKPAEAVVHIVDDDQAVRTALAWILQGVGLRSTEYVDQRDGDWRGVESEVVAPYAESDPGRESPMGRPPAR